jgi:hypothetical protein
MTIYLYNRIIVKVVETSVKKLTLKFFNLYGRDKEGYPFFEIPLFLRTEIFLKRALKLPKLPIF